MLSELNAALSKELEHRKKVLGRVVSKFRDRQTQLVNDILRAEAEHLELTDSLKKIEGSIHSIQGLAESAPPSEIPVHEAVQIEN